MATQQVKFTYGSTTGVITWDGSNAAAPILLDGDSTGLQTADARHNLSDAIELVLSKAFAEDVDMDDVKYETIGTPKHITMTAEQTAIYDGQDEGAMRELMKELMQQAEDLRSETGEASVEIYTADGIVAAVAQ